MSISFNKATLVVALALTAAAGSAEATFTSPQAVGQYPDDLLLVATDGTTTYIRDLATNASTFGASSQTFAASAKDLFGATFSNLSSVQWEVFGGYHTVDTTTIPGNPQDVYNTVYSAVPTSFKPDSSTPTNNAALYLTGLVNILDDSSAKVGPDGKSATELNSTAGSSVYSILEADVIGFKTAGSILGAGGTLPTTLNTISVTDITDPSGNFNTTDKSTSLPGKWTLASDGTLQYSVAVAAVPEPTTWVLLAASLFAVAGFSRRRNAI